MKETLLRVKDLHVAYGKAEVLHGLSFDLHVGEVLTIIGPNGAGKTTLLNSLMGLMPMRGEVLLNGQPIQDMALESRVMLGLSLVPERRELFGSMPVHDNLLLGAYSRMRRGERNWQDELEYVYRLFPRLKERSRQKAGTLSGGERQMLAVGRALMAKPSILMLDEPSLGLAPLIVKEIFSILAKLKSEGVTIILVEQNARAALQVADHAFVLEMGEFGLQGPATQLAQDSRVIDTYLGPSK